MSTGCGFSAAFMGGFVDLPYNKRPDITLRRSYCIFTHYPEGAFKQALYIIGWACVEYGSRIYTCLLEAYTTTTAGTCRGRLLCWPSFLSCTPAIIKSRWLVWDTFDYIGSGCRAYFRAAVPQMKRR